MQNLYIVRHKRKDYFFNDHFRIIEFWDNENYPYKAEYVGSLLYNVGFDVVRLNASDDRVAKKIEEFEKDIGFGDNLILLL